MPSVFLLLGSGKREKDWEQTWKSALKKTICNINRKVPANAVFTIYIFERLCFVFIQLYGDGEEADLVFPAYWRLAEPTTWDKKGKGPFWDDTGVCSAKHTNMTKRCYLQK